MSDDRERPGSSPLNPIFISQDELDASRRLMGKVKGTAIRLQQPAEEMKSSKELPFQSFTKHCGEFLTIFEYWIKGTGTQLKANCDRIERSLEDRPPRPTNKGYVALRDWLDVAAYPIKRDLFRLKDAAVRLADLPQNALDDWENTNADHYGRFGDGRFDTAAGYLRGLAARVAYHLHNLGSAYESGGFAHNRLEFDEPWQKVLGAKFSKPELDSIVTDVSVIQALLTEQFLNAYAELDFAELSSQLRKEFKRVRAKQANKQTQPAPTPLAGTVPAPSIKKPRTKKPRTKKPNANDLMKAELAANLEEVKGFTAQKWANKIGRAKSTVVETPTWKSLSLNRQQAKAEKAADRRRK